MSSRTQSPDELLEAWGDVVPNYDPEWFGDSSTMFGLLSRYQRPATTQHDRSDGRFLPVYQTEFDLAVIRAMGRSLAVMAPGLVGGLRNMCNYTIGEGFSFTATKEPTSELTERKVEKLLQAVQIEINQFLDQNDFKSGFDREIHDTSIIDGESFLYLQAVEDRVRIARCEPDQIRQPAEERDLEDWIQTTYGIPCDSFVSSWSFGVHTRSDAPAEPLGFHVVSDESGVNWEYVPADRMVHIKRNVTRNAKRGFSDLYPIEADSTRGEKLRRNMAEGAAIQSAIAFVRQHVAGVTRAGVETMLGENRQGTQSSSMLNGGSRPKSVVQYRPGTVVDLSAGLEYKPGPLGSERASDFLLVASYVQRMQAVRWSMPEYMFSGDASNANYASTMEATAPFVKSCEAEQRFYSRHFVSLLWKALKIRWELGAFDQLDLAWEEIEQSIKITAECPEVATRDELKNVQRQEILIRLGLLSRKTAATQNGLDFEAEVANGAAPEGQGGGQVSTSRPTPRGAPYNSAVGDQSHDKDSSEELDQSSTACGNCAGSLSESTLLECGGKGGKPGPCPKHLVKRPKTRRRRLKKAKVAKKSRSFGIRSHKDRHAHPLTLRPWTPLRSEAISTRGTISPSKLTITSNDQRSEVASKSLSGKKRLLVPPPATAPVAAKKYNPALRKKQKLAMIVQRNVARKLSGRVVDDNAPTDVKAHDIHGNPHFIEVKTIADRKTHEIKVPQPAFERKARVVAETGVPLSTVVEDHRYEYKKTQNRGANFSGHVIYYRRGAGSFRLDDMYKARDFEEVAKLNATADHDLPELARPSAKWVDTVKDAMTWVDRGKLKASQAIRAQNEANSKDFK